MLNNAISKIILVKNSKSNEYSIYSRQIRPKYLAGRINLNLSLERHILEFSTYTIVNSNYEKLRWSVQVDGQYLIPISSIPTVQTLARINHVCCAMPKPKKQRYTIVKISGICTVNRQVQQQLEINGEYVRTGIAGQVVIGPNLTAFYKIIEI